jgi:hypothetical protein
MMLGMVMKETDIQQKGRKRSEHGMLRWEYDVKD